MIPVSSFAVPEPSPRIPSPKWRLRRGRQGPQSVLPATVCGSVTEGLVLYLLKETTFTGQVKEALHQKTKLAKHDTTLHFHLRMYPMKFSTPVLQSVQFQDFCTPDLNQDASGASQDLTQQFPVLYTQGSGRPSTLHFLMKPQSFRGGKSWPRASHTHTHPPAHTHTQPPTYHLIHFSSVCSQLGRPRLQKLCKGDRGTVRPSPTPQGTLLTGPEEACLPNRHTYATGS